MIPSEFPRWDTSTVPQRKQQQHLYNTKLGLLLVLPFLISRANCSFLFLVSEIIFLTHCCYTGDTASKYWPTAFQGPMLLIRNVSTTGSMSSFNTAHAARVYSQYFGFCAVVLPELGVFRGSILQVGVLSVLAVIWEDTALILEIFCGSYVLRIL